MQSRQQTRRNMSRVFQLLAGGSLGNAVVAEAMAFEQAMREWGYQTATFAAEVHPSLAGRVLPLASCSAAAGDVLLLHVTADSAAIDFALASPARLTLLYHNFTPAQYMRGLGEGLAGRMSAGRARMALLRERADLVLADSSYNAQDLRHMGFGSAQVLPLLVPHDLENMVPDPRVLAQFSKRAGTAEPVTTLLFVGRVVPNKRVEDVLKVFYYYRKIDAGARLFVVGPCENSLPYVDWLREMVTWLRLENVYITGEVAPESLAAFYHLADVYLSMSEHEGFGAPLVESMRFKVPVLAYSSAAVPETLGSSGILIRRKDFAMVAGMIGWLQAQLEFRSRIVAHQVERAASFEPAVILQQLREHLPRVLEHPALP
jgi:L-malate glycosyltransferase